MRLIDAEGLERRYMEADYMDNDTAYDVIATLDNEITIDAVEVVRCKECKYGDTGTDEEGNKFWKCLGVHYGGTKPDDFCSYGERKESE